MFSKKMLLSYKRLPFNSFAMFNEKHCQIEYTHHYEINLKISTWWGLIKKTITEKASWNAPSYEAIEKQLNEKIGKWIPN